jgi:HD-GYP domain-containing protein (c-di-GMP phosphodiesterase class II)
MRLKRGMVLRQDIYSETGVLLLKKETILTETHINLLNRNGIALVQQLNTKDIQSEKPNELNEVVYRNVFTSIKDMHENIMDKSNLDDDEVLDMINKFDILHDDFISKDIEVLEIIEKFSEDEYLFKHSINVGLVASKIGSVLKLSKENQQLLARMGLFHDVGKLKIDPSILNKPSRLTDDEFQIIKQHPKLGYEFLFNTSLDPLIIEGTLKHHERLDGSGYPNGIKGEDIPFLVRILSVADTFDAICSNRVYRGRRSVFFAIEEMVNECNRNRLDSSIVFPFAYSLMKLLKNTKITLRNGKRGEISKIDIDHPNQPVLKVDGYPPLNLQKENLTLIQVANI